MTRSVTCPLGIAAVLLLLCATAGPAAAARGAAKPAGRDGTLDLLKPSTKAMRRAEEVGCGGIDLPAAPPTPSTGGHFDIYVKQAPVITGPGDPDLADYDAQLEALATMETGPFGWKSPPLKGGGTWDNTTDGARYPVVITSELDPGVFGFVTSQGNAALVGSVAGGDNPNSPWPDGDAAATCMALSNDFTQFHGTPLESLQATIAHEFVHALQFGTGALSGPFTPDASMIEATATYMEDEVADAANDNHFYGYPDFFDGLGEHAFEDEGAEQYEAWLLIRGLLERFGTATDGGGQAVIRDVFEQISRNERGFLGALDTSIKARGSDLGTAYHEGVTMLRFLAPCGPELAAPFCFEESAEFLANPSRSGALPTDVATLAAPGSLSLLIEEAYATHFIGLPASGTPILTVQSLGPIPLRATAACRTGASLRRTELGVIPAGAARATGAPLDGCASPSLIVTTTTRTNDDPDVPGLLAYRAVAVSGGSTSYPLTLTTAGAGAATGRIGSTYTGVECTTSCSFDIPVGSVVALRAAGATPLEGWGGDCSGVVDCTIEMTQARAVTASFSAPPPPPDTVGPVIAIPSAALRLKGRTVSVRLRCPAIEPNGCAGIATLNEKRGRRRARLARVAFTRKSAGQRFTVKFTLARAAVRKVKKAKRKGIRAELRLNVSDARGNKTTAVRALTLRR